MPDIFKAAVVQAEPVWLDAPPTTTKTVALIAEAAASGAELIATPEVWIPGCPAPGVDREFAGLDDDA